jgi:hypothetical protein
VFKEVKEKELNIVKTHTHTNNYDIKKIKKISSLTETDNTEKQNGPLLHTAEKERKKITEVFRGMQIKLSFRMWSTIQNVTK